MVEGDTFDQVSYVGRFLANTLGNLGKRIHQKILELRVHVIVCNFQRVFQRVSLNAEHFSKEAGEEDRVACLVGELRGQEDAHLLVGHGCDIGP